MEMCLNLISVQTSSDGNAIRNPQPDRQPLQFRPQRSVSNDNYLRINLGYGPKEDVVAFVRNQPSNRNDETRIFGTQFVNDVLLGRSDCSPVLRIDSVW